MNDTLFAIEHVSYGYENAGTGQPLALNRVSLEVKRGDYVALLGHNGSGKSTLARLLNGLLLPTSGQVLVDGMDTRDADARQRIRELVGMIFSDPDNQIVATLVEDDVAWGLAARGWPKPRIVERVGAALDAVGLAEMRGRPPHQLSGGQRQRLAIAGVLALQPACIVADEPTALLDPRARGEMVALLHDLHRTHGLTVVHVTHLLEEAALADRIIVLQAGRVILEGPPAAVLADLDRLRALRLVIPELAELGQRLREHGIYIPADALSPQALVRALEATR
ncbi:MAG: energy-coupling factor transporter ATPase [Ktedonobacterales bacterium]|jgi:energy-coupling factor transport system ATP-binding protein|nr:MAG: energy-coupling factor transporter ATPase [Ktedonobacterales bacterium]